MDDLFGHEILIARHDLLQDIGGNALRQIIKFFNKIIQSAMGAVFQNKVEIIILFYDLMAFGDIRMIQFLMDLHLLFQQLKVLLIFTNLAFVNHFNSD